jgi:hypothetical protein
MVECKVQGCGLSKTDQIYRYSGNKSDAEAKGVVCERVPGQHKYLQADYDDPASNAVCKNTTCPLHESNIQNIIPQ